MPASSLIFVNLLLCLAGAEDSYTIKTKGLAKGDVIKVERREDGEDTMVITVDQKLQKNENKRYRKEEIWFETIAQNPDDPGISSNRERKYEMARITENGKNEKRIYEDEIVTIERKADKYRFWIAKDKEITGKDAEDLDREFNLIKPRLLYATTLRIGPPIRPIAVGESWKINVPKLFKPLLKDIDFDEEGSKGTGKLLEVYEKAGSRFGRIDIELEAPIRSIVGRKTKFTEKGKINLIIHFDGCIDGTSGNETRTAEASVETIAVSYVGGKELKMDSKNKITTTWKVAELSKK